MKEWTIKDIEAITETTAKEMSLETLTIKGHTVYMIDFAGYFKYSMIVFFDGRHIKYANDYELHHPGKTREELRAWYIEAANNKLFTDEELRGPIASYEEYTKKAYYLRNYYALRRDYVSAFMITPTPEEEKTFNRRIARRHYNPVAFCYMSDLDFIKKHVALFNALEARKGEAEKNFDYLKDAFLREMWNHEYGINWQGDFDVLSVFGHITTRSENLGDLMEDLGFDDVHRRAYMAAQDEYFAKAEL